MENRIIIYLLLGISTSLAIGSVLTLNPYLIAISSAITLSMFFLYKLWEVFESIILKKTHVVQIFDGYELEGDRWSAVRSIPKGFSATAGALLTASPSKPVDRDSIERVICSSNSPFRFVVQVERLNQSKIVDDLKMKRRMKEIELAKTRASGKKGDAKENMIGREIELMENEIKEITGGSLPVKTEVYLLTTAIAGSRFAAQEKAVAQAKEISGEISAVLGAAFEQLRGAELVKLLKLDSFYNLDD